MYIWVANRYIDLEDYDNAAKFLYNGLSNARKYDELPNETIHTSFLVKDYVFEKSNVYSGFEGNDMKREIQILEKDSFYDKVKEMDWFKTLIEKYRPYAKDTKQI